jgi:prepilin-type N-terminal cleavage/methylation domain-containing protein
MKFMNAGAAKGFSLLELLVVMSIFSVISLMVLVNHSKFNSSVLLGSLAYNVALSIREAQVYGLSVRGSASGFQVGYGIHFAGATNYILFADLNKNKIYDSATDTIVKPYTVGQGHTVKKFCGVRTNGQQNCSDGTGTAPSINYLDVVFLRPEPDANITSNQYSPYSQAIIQVASPSGETRTITVALTGQVAVSNP